MEGHALQHPFPRIIAEPDILKLDFAPKGFKFNKVIFIRSFCRLFSVCNLRRHIHNRKNLFRRRKRALQHIELLRQRLNRIVKAGNIHIEGNHHTAGYCLTQKLHIIDVAFSAQIKQAHHRRNIQHIHHRTKNAKDKNSGLLGFPQGFAFHPKFFHLTILLIENLCNLHTGQIFRQISIHIGGGIVYSAMHFP